jgi:hypothetical protein
MSGEQTTDELKRAANHALAAIQIAVQEHPIASVAAGAGAGYILATGLPSWMVRAGAAIAVRTVAREIVAVAINTIAATEARTRAHSPEESAEDAAEESAEGPASGPEPGASPGAADVESAHVSAS